MGKPEAYVENYLVKQTKKHDIFMTKYTAAGTSGVPDRILIKNGYTVFIETKAAGETPRKLQDVIMKDMRKHGAYVYAINTREGIDRIINKILNHTLQQSDTF